VCGIVGNVLARADRRPDQAILEAMADRLAHRGPDEAGFVVRGPAGLGIRRLKIIDLDTGRQPMTGEDGRTWVVFNGEIYNYRELTSRLAASGHVFRTRSDTEAIVHAWETRGRDALEDLEGMFGLAVWHEPSQTLVLARDRLGVKPLYYAVLPDQIVFASELKAMLAHPAISRELDVDALSAYLAHEWLPAPQSIVRAVRKLPPGHRLVYTGGQVKVERWWDVQYGGGEPAGEIVAVAHLAAALDLSVRQHLIADVPLGVFLSGSTRRRWPPSRAATPRDGSRRSPSASRTARSTSPPRRASWPRRSERNTTSTSWDRVRHWTSSTASVSSSTSRSEMRPSCRPTCCRASPDAR
jgi:asparagine synthase (glutamine-hydrolysing)